MNKQANSESILEQDYMLFVGRDNAVGIATSYGLDGPGIGFRWGGEIFPARPDLPWDPPSFLYNGYRVSFPVVKSGRSVTLTTHLHLVPSLKK